MKAIKTLTLLALSIILVFSLAGCGSQQTSGAAKDGDKSGGKPYSEIKIGASQSLTAVLAPFGTSAVDGIKLAVEEINAAGGINGIPLSVIVDDEASEKDRALANVQKHIQRDKVLVEISPTGTGLAGAVTPLANSEGLPIMNTSSTGKADMVTRAGQYCFRDSIPESEVYPLVVNTVVKDTGATNAVLLYINDDGWGVTAFPVMKKVLEDAGLNILAIDSYSKHQVDFSALITKIKKLNPQIIALLGGAEDGPQFLIQADQMGLKPKAWIGGNPFNNPDVPKRAGKAAEGLIVGTAWFIGNDSPKNKTFVESFRKKYNKDPDQFNAQGYAAVEIFADAIKRTKLTGDLKKDREAIMKAVTETKALLTVVGPITFDQTRTPKGEGVVITQIRDGKFQLYKGK